MGTLERVAILIEKGQESKISNLLDKLESEVKLNPALLEKLNKLGDTPIAEPTLYEAMQKDRMALALEVLTREDIVSRYSAKEVGDFLHAVTQRITSIKNEDDTFKSTPNTENCELPNFIEVDELIKLGLKDTELRTKLKSAKTEKEKTKIIDEIGKLAKTTEDKAFEISGLDMSTLTEWEKSLVVTMVYTSAINANLSSVGKSLGNL